MNHQHRVDLAHVQLARLAQLGPEVLRVLAAAIAYQRAHGELPSAEVVAELARAEGASVGASLVMVRREIPDAAGRPCPLGGERVSYGHGIVEDAATCIALEIRALPFISLPLRRRDGRRVNNRDLVWTAENWNWGEEPAKR